MQLLLECYDPSPYYVVCLVSFCIYSARCLSTYIYGLIPPFLVHQLPHLIGKSEETRSRREGFEGPRIGFYRPGWLDHNRQTMGLVGLADIHSHRGQKCGSVG